jgi:phosphatidylglycerophosphate synthase
MWKKYDDMSDDKDGRKIHREIENPIDNVIIDAAARGNRLVHRYIGVGVLVTPNTITLLAMLFGFIAAWFAYEGHFMRAIAFTAVSYFFDCMDGNMARMFDLVTPFGDWFDHVSDVSKYVALAVALAATPHLSVRQKAAFFAVNFVLMMLMFKHMGCQERSYVKLESNSLSGFEVACEDETDIAWTRYFGMGTWIFSICVSLAVFGAAQV